MQYLKSRLLSRRILLVGFSLISLLIFAWAAAAHYRKLAWGDPWQPIGWLLSMFFLLRGNLSAVADSWLVPKQNVPPAISASSKASSPVPQLVQGYARRDCGHAPQTGVFWTLLLSRAAAVGLFAQCLIDKPD